MAKDDILELQGLVKEVLPGNMFRVAIDSLPTLLLCYLGGRLKQNKIRVILGDKVKVEISPYDLTKGRISYRL
jgi:translation initiation factor IF-1